MFTTLYGLDSAVRALQKALDGDQLAGTYLFVGPTGVGKTTLARAFAKAAACLNPLHHPFDACGECDSCRRAQEGAQPEIVLIPPAGDQTQIWQFWDRDNKPRGILQHTLPFAPTIGKRRVYIIERADTLNEAAANSLLKVLEEPPPYALFILLAPHAARMLPTILSRSQIVRLSPSPVDGLAAYLADLLCIEPDQARAYAAYAEGKTGQAMRLARNKSVQDELAKVLDFAENSARAEPLGALKVAETMRKIAASMKSLDGNDEEAAAPDDGGDTGAKERVGRKQLGIVLDLLALYYRDLLAMRLGGAEAPIVHADRRASISELARGRNPQAWMGCLEALLQARRRVDQNVSIPLLTDWLASKIVGG